MRSLFKTGNEVLKAAAQQASDLRTFIEGFTAWEVQTGLHNQYTGHYTLKDIDIIATRTPITSGGSVTGIEFGPNTLDMTVINAKIDGFEKGIFTRRHIINLNAPFDGIYDYIFANVSFVNVTDEWVGVDASDEIISGPVTPAPFSFQNSITGIFPGPGGVRAPNSRKPVIGGVKTDALGDQETSLIWDEHRYDFRSLGRAVEIEGFWKLPDGRTVTTMDAYFSDRVTHELIKDVVIVEVPNTDFRPNKYYVRFAPEDRGVMDINSRAPVATNDSAVVDRNTTHSIDVLDNDADPDGDALRVDGIDKPEHGLALPNGAGGIDYTPDFDFVGSDTFTYWVEDSNGKTSWARVVVLVQ